MIADGLEYLRKSESPTLHRGIPRSEEITGFAPLWLPGLRQAECRSRAGRLRLHHEFDRDGLRCIFCDAKPAA